jgi:hypothetical protein
MLRNLFVILVIAVSSTFAQDKQDPPKKPDLAELARKERERRSKSSSEVRLITNEDLATMKSARVVTGRAPVKATSADDEKVPEDSDKEKVEDVPAGPDMDFWKAAFSEAKTNLQNAINNKLVLELRINNLRNSFYREEDGATREMIQGQVESGYSELDELRKLEQDARKALLALQTEAAKAGLLPGEIRDLVGEIPESKSIELTVQD